ncbi:MAG: Rpn family recombination-promoting nuclease/putative transposase [Defluviitaleaceae bacterium]|nr:Rpn family recombination-promoting nuclease/putative transposase [Defluviitaleaceae bacterium]
MFITEVQALISLLNAVFENAGIRRIIKSLTIGNPYLEKRSDDDKLSVLDIIAILDDGTKVLIEMHLYSVYELKFKTIRSWAHTYATWLKESKDYSSQPPVICVSFINEPIDPQNINEVDKVHKCCKIADISTGEIFSDALELHYINMKAYAKSIKTLKNDMTMLEKWLAVLTEKDLADKTLIKTICDQEEEINMAVATLVKLSADAPTQEEYRKWREEQDERRRRDMELVALRESNAEQKSALAEKDKIIAKLLAERTENKKQ